MSLKKKKKEKKSSFNIKNKEERAGVKPLLKLEIVGKLLKL